MKTKTTLNRLLRAIAIPFVSFSILVLFSVFKSPGTHFIYGVASLSIPLFAVANLILFCYLLWRKSWWAAYALVVPIAVFTCYDLFSLINTKKNFQRSFGLLTFNTDQLIDSITRIDHRKDFTEWVIRKKFDVICLQEMLEVKDDTFNIPGYQKIFSGKQTSPTEHFGVGLFSRLPIVNHGVVEFGAPSFNRLLWADILFDNDTIRVVTVHLKSYNFQQNAFKVNLVRLQEGVSYRTWHASMTKQFIDTSPYPVVLCGDFNEPTHSYSYRLVSKGLSNAFHGSGDFFEYTFWLKGMPIRIDHILTSNELQTKDFEVTHGLNWSDHSPVSVRIGWQDQVLHKHR
jgi:endonuclease/exonuclease/phosphatase family metal-dependent hydrolase